MKYTHQIEANIKGLGNDLILVTYFPLSRMVEMQEPFTDIAYSENGRFNVSLSLDEPSLVYLFPKKGEFTRLSGKPFRPDQKHIFLLAEPIGKSKVMGELQQYYLDYQVQGSDFNEEYARVRRSYIEATSEAVAIELQIDTLQDNSADREEINALFQRRNEIGKAAAVAHLEYIKSNLDKDLAAFYLLRQPLEVLGKYYNELSPSTKNGIFMNPLKSVIIRYHKYTKVKEAELKIKAGESAPHFSLQSLHGNFSLNAIEKKYIILDFWGSWCAHCIQGIPKMKEYYYKYKGKVEIIGISCNESEEKWRRAVQKFELPWIQVINAPDIDKDVSVMYGIQNYPTKIILDKNRKIVARYIGETDEFYKSLDELILTK